jgi:hypothetical protein
VTFWTGIAIGVAGCALTALGWLAFMEFFNRRWLP